MELLFEQGVIWPDCQHLDGAALGLKDLLHCFVRLLFAYEQNSQDFIQLS